MRKRISQSAVASLVLFSLGLPAAQHLPQRDHPRAGWPLYLLPPAPSVPDNLALSGGGLINEMTALLDRTSVYGNSTKQSGGGIANETGTDLVLINTTISDNNVVASGGGIYNSGVANVYNSTIAVNGADSGRDSAGTAGGVTNRDATGTFNPRNTLVAGNVVGNAPVSHDGSGTLNADGEDLFGEDTLCTIHPVGGAAADSLNSLDFIGPLANNGGPTLTRALLLGSNAIHTGVACVDENSLPLPIDQHGVTRIVGLACDVGAYEFLPPVAYLPLIRR